MERHRELLSATYDRFGGDVYRYLAVLMGSRDHAEDVMQEVFMRLVPVARRDPKALESRAYVLRVARNEAWRALGQLKRHRVGSGDGLLHVRDPRQGNDSERLAIQEALASLLPEQREALHLKVFMGMTFDEIATVTDVPPNTAASRYRYALDKMREMLSDVEDHL